MKLRGYLFGVKYFDSHRHFGTTEFRLVSLIRVNSGAGWHLWLYFWQEAILLYYYPKGPK